MNPFKTNKKNASILDRINWKAVQLRKVKADSEKIKVAYKILINGVVVGAIGEVKNSISKVRNWVWIERTESFTQYHFDQLSYSRRSAIADLLYKLEKDGVLA